MLPSELVQLQLQYIQYQSFCNRFGYTPTEMDRKNVVRYLLLMAGDGTCTTLSESEINEKWVPLFEAHGHGSDFSFLDSAGSISIPDIGLGKYVSYLFKRPALSRLFKEEMMDEFEKMRQWKKLMELKKKLAAAKGEPFASKVDLPTLHRSKGSKFGGDDDMPMPRRTAPKKPAH